MGRLSLALLALLAVAATLSAQDANGRISGTVTDNSGAVIPKAKITVTNQSTKLTWKTAGDDKGFYIITNLPVGTYNVETSAAGFRSALQTGYELPDSGRITADFKLELGGVSQSVTVTEVIGESVNTVSGELAHTIDSEQVQDLALNGRNYMELVTLMPGVMVTSLDQMATTTSLSVTNQSINGNRTDTNHLAVDGGSNLDSGSNGSQINNVGVDFIQQVRIQTSAFSAEFGRNSGANINVVTKSGGNQFHGSLFETIRNDALDAKDFFAPIKPVLRFNDYGWSLNGPIAVGRLKKGKLFFMVGEEWKSIHHYTSASRQTLPTLAETQGNFSDRTNAINFPGTTTPIPGKVLPPSLITPDGKAIMAVYAKMSTMASVYTNTPVGNNATFQAYNPFNWREDIARIDYRLTDKHTIYFRYLHDNYNTIDPFGTFGSSPLPNSPTQRHRPGYGPQAGYTWIVSPHIINEARLSSSWNGQRTYMQGDLWKRATYGFQFPRLFGGNGEYPEGMPDVTVSGFATFYSADHVFLASPTTDISLSDNVTFIHNEHTFKTGLLIVRNRKDQNATSYYDGLAAFNSSGNTNTTGYTLADVLTGYMQTYTEAANDPIGFFRFSQYDGFVQDSWRVAKRFSIEVGLRYSHYLPTYTVANNMSNFVPSLYDPAKAVSMTLAGLIVPNSGNPYNGLIRVGTGIPADQASRVVGDPATIAAIPASGPRGLYNVQNLWMPRFSFAWAPFKDNKTSLRGGFGTYHDRPEGNLVFSQTKLPPFTPQVQYQNSNLSNPGGGSAPAAAPQGGITAIDPNLKVPAVYTYNFGIQRELPWGMLLETTYAGNVGHHLIREPNINEPSFPQLVANQALPTAQRLATNSLLPYKGYTGISYYVSDSNSNYNALQVRATRRRGNTLFTINYTWSHALADSPANFSSTTDTIEWADRHYNYGPTNYDRRHLFVATATYRIPFMAKAHGLVHGAFGGWEMSAVGRIQTGQYLTPTGSNYIPGTRRAEYIGGTVALPSDQRGVNKFFNTAAFANSPATALGNAGVGVIEGPGWQNWDISLRKVFTIREGWSLRIQADTFNIANHPNFNNPDVSTTSSTFGAISSSQPARNIQFGARFAF